MGPAPMLLLLICSFPELSRNNLPLPLPPPPKHAHTYTDTLFPWLASRVELPAKMSDFDEPTLLALLDRVRDLGEALTASPTSTAKVGVPD